VSCRFKFAIRAGLAAVMAVVLWAGSSAGAADSGPIVVVFDKAEVLRLAKPARRVIVGNPAIADISMETPTMLYVFGKALGETSLVVLGDDDHALLSRPVVVTTASSRAVTVHVPGGDGPTSRVYSCVSGNCLRVANPEAANGGSAGGR
jgi:Flp pilus assembly secretin CpaC